MKHKTRRYLAESFAAFKNSKKEDPFAKEEVEEVEQEETDAAEEEDAEEAEEVEQSEEDAKDVVEKELEDEESESGEDTEVEIEVEIENEDDDSELEAELAAEDESDTEEQPSNNSNSFGSVDTSSLMGGMSGLTSFKRPEWAITRVMTDNGERIAMEYQNETECEVLVGNLTYTEADSRSSEIAQQLNLSVFNSETDKYLGKVSSKVVRKQEEPKRTSYKY